ncbi:hypothetical protein ACFV28_02160 [Streptomyces sp. NPDC059720]|uniref:hypothetical protein n=1 Tax=Streptomyces sp. NPDC059720 TaxID=3346924 RepID=UPI00369ABAE3
MTDQTASRSLGEGTWSLPLVVLAPVVAIRLLTEPAMPWQVVCWALCAVSAVLLITGWAAVARHGMRQAAAWGTCVLAHALLAWQVIALVLE